jgi:hypothetical protein
VKLSPLILCLNIAKQGLVDNLLLVIRILLLIEYIQLHLFVPLLLLELFFDSLVLLLLAIKHF